MVRTLPEDLTLNVQTVCDLTLFKLWFTLEAGLQMNIGFVIVVLHNQIIWPSVIT